MSKTQTLFQMLHKRWMSTADSNRLCGVNSLAQRVSQWRARGITIIDRWEQAGGSRFKSYKAVR